jgi:hypothetical protein
VGSLAAGHVEMAAPAGKDGRFEGQTFAADGSSKRVLQVPNTMPVYKVSGLGEGVGRVWETGEGGRDRETETERARCWTRARAQAGPPPQFLVLAGLCMALRFLC